MASRGRKPRSWSTSRRVLIMAFVLGGGGESSTGRRGHDKDCAIDGPQILAETFDRYALVHAVLLRRIPVEAPDRLVRLGQMKGDIHSNVSPANLTDWRTRAHTLVGMSGWQIAGVNLKAGADAERVRVAFVEPSLQRLLGLQPALGRAFTDDEARPGNDRVLLLTPSYWKSRLGGDPSAIGRTLQMSGAPYTIVGILPETL